MVLKEQNVSAYNEMLGRMQRKRSHAKDTLGKKSSRQTSIFEREPKRAKSSESPTVQKLVIPDSDAESGDEPLFDSESSTTAEHVTDLEQSLPPIKTDKEAIQEYEASRAAEAGRTEGGGGQWVKGRSSIYVDAFKLALNTVLEDESHLFSDAEKRVFDEWKALDYEAQYLYVRLFLRKTAAWHRINRLRYYEDIADTSKAAEELFRKRDLPAAQLAEECFVAAGELSPPEGSEFGDSFTFADSSEEHISDLEEASSLLMLEELRTLAKEAKVAGGVSKNKRELLKALRQTSGTQTSLTFGKCEDVGAAVLMLREESASSATTTMTKQISSTNRDAHYVSKILSETTGPCIRLSRAALQLFERVHLVFYRSSEWTEKSLTTIILARIARRNFPAYIVSRSGNVFASRALLLEFEAAVRTQFCVDSILEFNGTPTREGLQRVLDIFDAVYPRWQQLLAAEEEEQQRRAVAMATAADESICYATAAASGERAYLRRLSPAWVYTRIVHKGAGVLGVGKFKQHLREHAVLTALLDQRLFHVARRGAWYQRKALLEEHYMAALTPADGRSAEEQKKHWKRIALATCDEGLQDNMVHLIYHYDLQKRIMKLEKSLKIARRLQHVFAHAALTKPVERVVEGVRIERRLSLPATLARTSSSASTGPAAENPPSSRRGARTVWLDARENNAECSVEAMCLSWYREQGWKGYHSEGGIVRTLFGLLFYDILFAYVPNVFQTAYQTCPLDLHTDAFYGTRLSEINARCAEISNGGADALLCRVWEREVEAQTCVVGVDWSYELADLREIVRCFGGEQLATVCRVMTQEYAQRGGGVPDLFMWHVDRNEVCFAEVKSENDRLSDTQRLWIHVLMGAGVRVELCNAVAKEVRVLD